MSLDALKRTHAVQDGGVRCSCGWTLLEVGASAAADEQSVSGEGHALVFSDVRQASVRVSRRLSHRHILQQQTGLLTICQYDIIYHRQSYECILRILKTMNQLVTMHNTAASQTRVHSDVNEHG